MTGGDWDELVRGLSESHEERVVLNMGPQHPSTHGVLRLILELEGESVTEARCGIGYLHTGIEKNLEFRSWTQGVTFVTRMDYLSPFYNEAAYCLAVEKLLGITDEIPERATVIRVMLMELNRISSHLVCLATGGMELGALDRDDLRLPRARAGARPVRADHRPADEPRVHPPWRRVAGPPAGSGREGARDRRVAPAPLQGHRESAGGQRHLDGPHRRGRLSRPHRLHRARHDRTDSARDRAAARPAQEPAVLRVRDL